jgi:phosphoadenosine phosphosulfate reductase
MSSNAALSLPEVQLDDPRELIRWGLARAERPVTTTKFGPESAVLLHMLVQEMPEIPVIWVDTGYNTRATQQFAWKLTEQLNLNLQLYRPLDDRYEEVPALDDPYHAEFTQRVKLEPFQRAIGELQPDVWFSALRSEQTEHRAGLKPVEQSPRGYLKVQPLLGWTEEDMHEYLAAHGLPSEPDYFDPTKGESRRECGLHLAF